MKKYILLGLTFLLFLSAIAYGQGEPSQHFLHLQAGSFDPLATGQLPLAHDLRQYDDEVVQPYYLVQFTGPVDAVSLAQVAQLGGEVLGYIPDNAHLVRLPATAVADVRTLPTVRWVGEMLPGYKLSGELLRGSARTAEALLELYVVAFPGESAAALADFVTARGGEITSGGDYAGGPVLRIKIAGREITVLAQNPAVQWVERFEQPVVDNTEGRRILGAETIWQNYGYFGEGQIVAISDSGLSVQGNLSADFNGRLIKAYAPSQMNLASAECQSRTSWTDINGHGTHVAGSVLGTGANSGANPAANNYGDSAAGVAPRAQMIFMSLNTDGSSGIQCIDDNADYIAKGYENGARISSNSWGAGNTGAYGYTSMSVDDYIWRHKDYIVLFAAGNAGPGASTIGSPGTAKNILTVGASENYRPFLSFTSDNPNEMADFSSRGPTADGRIKPDIVAPGTNVVSVLGAQANSDYYSPFLGDPNYASSDGTSMATPLAAGAVTLVREWLNKARHIMNPSAAFIKALMIHGAYQMPGYDTPNFETGWGRVDLKNTLNGHYVTFDDHVQGLATGQAVNYTIQIAASNDEATLYAWPQPLVGAADTLTITPYTSVAATGAVDAAAVDGRALPSSAVPTDGPEPIPTSNEKEAHQQLTQTAVAQLPAVGSLSGNFTRASGQDSQEANSFGLNIIGGGDFEDPAWSNLWESVWLGAGVPVRTDDPNFVISGDYSMWLGGTASNDSLIYPISFPDQIDNSTSTFLALDILIADEDIGYDRFCVALIDPSGNLLAPFSGGAECAEENNLYSYQRVFTPAELNALAGTNGYLAVFTIGDGVEPHMSAFVDNVQLVVDYPDTTLTAAPTSGPAGTTFLLTGKYNIPYGVVDICVNSCAGGQVITSAYADGSGTISAYIETASSATAGTLTIESSDLADRTATINLTITGSSNPTASVTPMTGAAGTSFRVTGSGFLPNDYLIDVAVNGESLGTVSSGSSGEVEFDINTQSNTPAGAYNVVITDSAQRTATTSYTVTAPGGSAAKMTVSPQSGAPGTTFTFSGSGFAPHSTVSFEMDGQPYGELDSDAAGKFEATLSTETTMPPGSYVLRARQGNRTATAEFVITGSGGGGNTPQSGNGLYVTLVWTDPPANLGASKTLVNDLDVTVQAPDNTLFYGNGGNGADRTNNVETIRLETLTAGTYTIRVEAHSVNGAFGGQPYALLVTTKQQFGATATTNSVNSNKSYVYMPLLINP